MTRFAWLIFIIAIVASIIGCTAKNTRLLGTWQSDKKATEDYLSSQLKLDPSVIAALDKVLGNMKITYTPTNVIFENCELAGTYRYEIVATNGDEIQVQNIGTNGERSTVSTIRFASASEFWSIPSKSRIPGFREKFKKNENAGNP